MRKLRNYFIAFMCMVMSAGLAQATVPVTDGLVMHLDASAISGVANNAEISQWIDISGQGNNAAQVSEVNQPTYVASSVEFGGNVVVRFDGIDDYMALPSPAPFNVGSVTVFAVGKFVLDGNTQYMLAAQDGGGNDRLRFAVEAQNDGFEFQAGNSGWKAINTGNNTADEDVHIFGITSVVGITEGFLDGISVGTSSGNSSTETPVALNIGSYNVGQKGFFSGDIAALIIYDRVLAEQEITDVTDYLISAYLLDNGEPDVDAGSSYVTWIGNLPQGLAGSVTDEDVTLVGIDWTVVSYPDGANAILTNTSTLPNAPTANFNTDTIGDYTIQLSVTDGVTQSVSDTLVVYVAEDACAAAQQAPSWTGFNKFDANENCIIDLFDFAVFAHEWLGDASLTAAEPIESASVKIIAIIGDSTVCEYSTSGVLRGWGQFIQEYFLPYSVSVINKAKSGRSTKTFIQEGLWAETLAAKPAYVLIQFGHNDSHAPENSESTDAETDYSDYLRQYIDESRAIGAVPVLVTPMYRRIFDEQGNLEDNLVPYANAMKKVAAEKNVPVVDLNAASAELYLHLGHEGCEVLANTPSDPTHFNETGARTIAELVMEQLSVVEPSFKPYLKKTN